MEHVDDTAVEARGLTGTWRSGNPPWYLVWGAIAVVVVVVLGCASTGSWAGVAGIVVVLFGVISHIAAWAAIPLVQPHPFLPLPRVSAAPGE